MRLTMLSKFNVMQWKEMRKNGKYRFLDKWPKCDLSCEVSYFLHSTALLFRCIQQLWKMAIVSFRINVVLCVCSQLQAFLYEFFPSSIFSIRKMRFWKVMKKIFRIRHSWKPVIIIIPTDFLSLFMLHCTGETQTPKQGSCDFTSRLCCRL